MNRARMEAETAARQAGFRSFAEMAERRARDRRKARLESDWESERRHSERRAADRLARNNAFVNDWAARFHAARK